MFSFKIVIIIPGGCSKVALKFLEDKFQGNISKWNATSIEYKVLGPYVRN
jgi:hypothetical protein